MTMEAFKEVLTRVGEQTFQSIATDYIDFVSFNLDYDRLAEHYNVPKEMLRHIFQYVIIHCLLTEEKSAELKVVAKISDDIYEQLLEKRELFKESEKVRKEISWLEKEIDNFDSYRFEEDGVDLEKDRTDMEYRLANLKIKLKDLSDYKKLL